MAPSLRAEPWLRSVWTCRQEPSHIPGTLNLWNKTRPGITGWSPSFLSKPLPPGQGLFTLRFWLPSVRAGLGRATLFRLPEGVPACLMIGAGRVTLCPRLSGIQPCSAGFSRRAHRVSLAGND